MLHQRRSFKPILEHAPGNATCCSSEHVAMPMMSFRLQVPSESYSKSRKLWPETPSPLSQPVSQGQTSFVSALYYSPSSLSGGHYERLPIRHWRESFCQKKVRDLRASSSWPYCSCSRQLFQFCSFSLGQSQRTSPWLPYPQHWSGFLRPNFILLQLLDLFCQLPY